MFGAEHLLMNRAKDEKVFNEIVDMVNRYKQYFIDNKQVVYENPSPGNKAGGITTLEEKSCGCIQKGGLSIINGVIDYGDQIVEPGLNLLYGPGNDLSSTTAIGSAGAQLILFTTGRGTPYGSFVPTAKVATNSTIYNKKTNWFDFNAGIVLDECDLDEACDIFLQKVVDIINGEIKTNNEKKEYNSYIQKRCYTIRLCGKSCKAFFSLHYIVFLRTNNIENGQKYQNTYSFVRKTRTNEYLNYLLYLDRILTMAI